MIDDAADLIRLKTLAGAAVASEAELLRLGVQHALSGTGAVGGFAHLHERDGSVLRLAAVAGLSSAVARRWEAVPEDSETAPARALRTAEAAWGTQWPEPPEDEPPGNEPGPAGELCVLALPIEVAGAPVGTLSVLAVEPPDRERPFLGQLVSVVSERLGTVAVQRPGFTPRWRDPAPSGASRVRSVPVAMWCWDLGTGLMHHGPEAGPLLRLAGLDPDRWDHRVGTLMARVHPDDRSDVEADVRRAVAERKVLAVEFRVVDAAGHSNWISLRGQFHFDVDGAPTRLDGHSWDITSSRSVLQWLPSLLENHPDPLYTFLADRRVVWSNRAAKALAAEYDPDHREEASRWPVEGQGEDEGAHAIIRRAQEADGAVVTSEFSARMPAEPTPRTWRARAVLIGEHISVQLEDVSAQREAERAAVRRAERVDRFREAMTQAVRARDAAAAVAEHVLPMVDADGLLVYQFRGDATTLVGSTGYAEDYLEELHRKRLDGLGREFPALKAPQFFSSLEELARARPRLAEHVRAGGKQAWFSLPLAVAGEHVGHCVLSWKEPRTLSTEEHSLLTTLGGLLAQALERGRLFDLEHSRAQALRQALRTRGLPRCVAVTVAARHHPVDLADRLGSWCAAFPLPGARTMLVSASMGRDGLQAAIAMRQLRTTVTELARLDAPLDELAAQISECEIVTRLRRNPERLRATLLAGLYDATDGSLNVLSAGHPAPLLTRPWQGTEVLPVPVGVPLGASAIPYETYRCEVPPGSVLCVSTAALAAPEDAASPAPPLARALDAAVEGPAGRAPARLADLCERAPDLVGEPADRRESFLVSRLDRLAPERSATLELPCESASAGRARRWVAEQLALHGLSDLGFAAELSVSELVSNTSRHARGPVVIRLLRLDGSLVIQVYDRSQTAPRLRPLKLLAEDGRGLLLVAQTAEEWGSYFTEDGKCIWITLAVAGADAAEDQD